MANRKSFYQLGHLMPRLVYEEEEEEEEEEKPFFFFFFLFPSSVWG